MKPPNYLRKIVWLILAMAALLIVIPAFSQDTLSIQPQSTPYKVVPKIDTLAVVTESIVETDGDILDKVFDQLGFLTALWTIIKHINWIYVIAVIASYYYVSVRVPFIPTNAFWKRNLAIAILTSVYGFIAYLYFSLPMYDTIVSVMSVNFCYEFFFKVVFRGLEKIGWLPLPAWYVQEVTDEKRRDILHVQKAQAVQPPPPNP